MRIVLVAAITGLLCASADAEDQAAARGVGTASCAEFGVTYKADPKYSDLVFNSWAQGFMSGLNFQLAIDGKRMRNLPASNRGQAAHIRQICDRRPLAAYVEVVMDYFKSLPEMPRPQSN